MKENEREAKNKMQKNVGAGLHTRPQKGITLIALIITIIVMLILVGVTINVAINGGLFGTAQFATKETQIEAEKEQLLSAVVASYETETGLISKSKLETNLGTGWSVNGSDGGPYTVTSPKGNIFTVNKDGTIIEGENNTPKALYEYTLAEIIEIAKNSSNAMYYDESESEEYVEGEAYNIILVIPFSEFWKEGIPDSEKNGTESGDFYKYEVTVEKLPYVDIGDGSPEGDRGIVFAGVSAEMAQEGLGIETTEKCIIIEALGLTAEDDLAQIKIKKEEPEPEPEFNEFTLGDLVNAGTETLGDDNKTYFDIPVAEFNEIIGQDITTAELENYIILDDGLSINLGTKTEYYNIGYIRMISKNTEPYVFDMTTNAFYFWYSVLLQTDKNETKRNKLNNADEGFKWISSINAEIKEGDAFFICIDLIKNKETNEKVIRLGVMYSADEPTFTKEEIPEGALNATLKPLNNKKLIKFAEQNSNN